MLPLNARQNIQRLLIDDFLVYGNCRNAERILQLHFISYGSADEISFMTKHTEKQLGNLMDDCILLIAASAKRTSVLGLIRERSEADEVQACRLFAAAELRWTSQSSENFD